MAKRISLSLVIHNHQPVGNFGWVIEDVFRRAYRPLLEALERHPGIQIGLHYSGPLLDWMRRNRPESIELVRALVDRGQVEIVGGAYYEPILVSLPDRDRHGQLVRMADELEALFGTRPRGAWLAERVWEPSLPYDLAEAGYRWTVLDDNHLRAASVREDEMWTAYTTDDRGRQLTVFGTEQGLRYRIPFKPVETLIAYLEAQATEDGRYVGMMGDDGEKFGAWPGTFEYCWSGEHWVDRCFEAIEDSAGWLSTVSPSAWLANHPPTGRIYVPASSYLEMTEWALPVDETPVFAHLVATARDRDLPEARFLKGGFWRNFAARYREINDLHKQMLRASNLVEAMADGPAQRLALDHLYQGQSNDCYWHGLFGGIYIVHMRMATLGHLVAAEDLALMDAAAAGRPAYGAGLEDVDLDAVDEAVITTPGQSLVVELSEGAGIGRWDLRASRLAAVSVMRRRPEAYHQRLIEHEQASVEQQQADETLERAPGDEPRTIHDIVHVKERGLSERLHYDRYERRSGLVHLLPAARGGEDATPLARLLAGDFDELGDFADLPFELVALGASLETRRAGTVLQDGRRRPLVVTARLTPGGDRLGPTLAQEVSLENPGRGAVAFELGLEWNFNMLGGGHNPDAYYEAPDGPDGAAPAGEGRRPRTPHDAAGDLARATHLAFGNDHEGVRIAVAMRDPARVSWFPIETVSNSEAGFERVYQGSALMFRWPVTLAPGERRSFEVRFKASQAIDRTAAELREAGADQAGAEGPVAGLDGSRR